MSQSKFHYLAGIVAVSREDLEAARARVGGEEVPVDEVLESTETPDTDDESFRRARAVIDLTFGFFRHDDPPAAVEELALGGIEGSVIHIVGLANHWAAYPATRPEPVAVEDLEGVPPTGTDQFVAVIDTGVVSGGPAWFADGISPLSDFGDTTTAAVGASHGTFIAGLIRRLACHRVSMATLPMVGNHTVVSPEGMPILIDVSTEIHLFAAVSRLIDRDEPFRALNLSVGTYTQNDLSSLIMRKALDLWFERFPEAAVFAAGGNEYEKGSTPLYSPLWPAALGTDTGFAHHDGVFGVGAVDRNGSDVVWDYHPSSGFTSVETLSSGALRPWIKVRAPGTDLISIGDVDAGGLPQFVKWSGSSFATPVALATYLNEGMSPPPDTRHDEVEGLTHEVDGSLRQTSWKKGSPCAPVAKSAS